MIITQKLHLAQLFLLRLPNSKKLRKRPSELKNIEKTYVHESVCFVDWTGTCDFYSDENLLILADVSSMYTCFTDMERRRKSVLMLKWLQQRSYFSSAGPTLKSVDHVPCFLLEVYKKTMLAASSPSKVYENVQKTMFAKLLSFGLGKVNNWCQDRQ